MNRRMWMGALVVAAVVFVGAVPAFAQESSPAGEYIQPHTVTVAFPFMLAGKQMAAGTYSIEQPTREALIFQMSKPGAPRTEVPVITRLAAPATPLTQPKLIFDKVGDVFYLSEVWFSRGDGFLLYGSKEAHTHQTVNATKK